MRRFARMSLSLMAASGLATTAWSQTPVNRRPPGAPAAAPNRPGMNAPAQNPARPAAPVVAPAAKNAMAAPAIDPAETERLFRLWEAQSAKLNSLDVGFTRTDTSPGWNSVEEYKGRAYLQNPNLACLHSQKVVKEQGKADKLEDFDRIVCTGKEVRQYDFATRQIFVFPLAAEERKKALQEGPLPFLFNMKADAVKLRYSMTVLNQNEKYYLLGVVPRLDTDKEVFSNALLQLDKKTYLPDRLLLIAPNGKDRQDYVFNGIKSNEAINPKLFQGLNIEGWKLVENPLPDNGGPPRPVARGGAAPPGSRPQIGAGAATPTHRD